MNTQELLSTTDAKKWAEVFMENFNQDVEIDEGLMIGWFANAIETGKLHGEKKSNYVQQAIRTESRPEQLNFDPRAMRAFIDMVVTVAQVADQVKRHLYYGAKGKLDVHLFQQRLAGVHGSAARLQIQGESVTTRDDSNVSETVALDAINIRLLHSAIGIFTESGEMFENISDQFNGRGLDLTNFAEELGDVDWYKAIGHDATGISEEQLREANIAKLRKRYPEKFTSEDAIVRDVVGERQVLQTSLGKMD